MKLKMKIVAFIAPDKFKNLFSNEVQINNLIPQYSGGFVRHTGRMNWLNNGQNIIYIKLNEVKSGPYEESLFNDAVIVLMDDNYQLNHTFNSDFKLLYHSETIRSNADLIHSIKSNSKCIGFAQSMEEFEENGKTTPYYEIALLIERGIREESVQIIYDSIQVYNPVLEAKLNLLHECLTPEGASEVEKISNYNMIKELPVGTVTVDSFIKKHFVIAKDNLAKDYIEKLTELRISLLGS